MQNSSTIEGMNCVNYASFEDQESVWTPVVSINFISATIENPLFLITVIFLQGNESIMNRELVKELYAEKKPDNMTQEEWDQQQSEKDDDERLNFRVLSLIMEAKRPNETAFETLLTREALYA